MIAKLPQLDRIDYEILLAHAINKPRSFLYAHPEYKLTGAENEIFNELCKRRALGEPIAYILGKREFWSLELNVDSNVLIPRPETELLVEIALENLNDQPKFVADLGTGSGAIALALAKERPNWSLVAVDKSNAAINIAKKNAEQLQIKNVDFICGDWCAPLAENKFTAIISNPPYIAMHDPHLEQGDLRFEPKSALISEDGLADLKKIIIQAKNKLIPGGLLILEHGYDQGDAVASLMRDAGYHNITSRQDLNGHYRVTKSAITL